MGRIQGLAESGLLTGPTLVKNAPGYVFSITIAWTGATAGNKVFLRDGTSAGSQAEVVFVLSAATGTITKEWPQGKQFETGIYFTFDGPSGVFAELTFK